MAVCEVETATPKANNSEQGLEPESEVTSNGTLPYAARVRTNIMGIMVDRTTRQQVLDDIDRFIASQTPHQIVTVNVDFINIAEREPSFIELLNRAAISVPDGMPLLWISRLLGSALPERITGTDLLLGSAEAASHKGRSIFLLGAADGVAAEAAQLLAERYPGLRIAGAYSPPHNDSFDPAEDERTVALIRAARPDLLFVALGTPKQERWIAEHLERLGVPVCIGVGGVFNFITGRVPRAPYWMQRAGLEWFFRLICEPRRLWRRYLLEDTRALTRALVYSMRTPPARRANLPVDPFRTQPIPIVPLSPADAEWHLTAAEGAIVTSAAQLQD